MAADGSRRDLASGDEPGATPETSGADASGPEALPHPDAVGPDVDHLDGGPAVTMSFFVTSKGSGAAGGNLGGLAGADTICQDLAAAVGMGHKMWHAYLSTEGAGGQNARDRIGTGPWYNVQGIRIAASLTELHGDAPFLNAETALDETGARVPGFGSPTPPGNQQDILTGSRPDGTAFPSRTCKNWTDNTIQVDTAAFIPVGPQVGHFDRIGFNNSVVNDPTANPQSWNSAERTYTCTQDFLKSDGGGGRLYCFAVN